MEWYIVIHAIPKNMYIPHIPLLGSEPEAYEALQSLR